MLSTNALSAVQGCSDLIAETLKSNQIATTPILRNVIKCSGFNVHVGTLCGGILFVRWKRDKVCQLIDATLRCFGEVLKLHFLRIEVLLVNIIFQQDR